jgi:DNA gyrase subunit A
MNTPNEPKLNDERIVDIELSAEMQASFLEYSYSVIYSRALPDARDGLKPVQRRIVYQMGEMGLRPDRGHVKSARVTGEVMGKLHPHGDSAIYDALVRMSQDFTLREPLVDGHGNFGSLDDGPAAARYTEVRLSPMAMLMNENLDEDVVDFRPNYDAQLTEPEVLPAAFPNLLVNGAAGIAVGMATNMAPHNLREVIAGARHLLDNPGASNLELMKFIPGPDLPNGGIILGTEGIVEAYETGRGVFKTRAKVNVESVSPRKMGIVVTELPYLIGPEKVIEKIKDGVTSKKLQGISDVTDLTDRTHGLRLVIELKTGFDPDSVLELLYRFTPLEDSFGINNVALVNGRPQTLNLRDLLGEYLAHRILVTKRRSENRLGKKQARLHLIDGLLLAIDSLDEVIAIIRASEEVDEARKNLMTRFKLSELQAEYILELRLRRLTKFSKLELESEGSQLRDEIAALKTLLGDPALLRSQVSDELQAVSEKYGTDRRTKIAGFEPVVARSIPKSFDAELADSPCSVVLTASGMLYRALPEGLQKPNGRFKHDAIRTVIQTSTRSDLGFITSTGRMLRIHAADIPVENNLSTSQSMVNSNAFLGLTNQESIISAIELVGDSTLALGTSQGVVKRVTADYPNKLEFEMISLKEGDEIVGAAIAEDEDTLVFVTSDAQLLNYSAKLVRPQGRTAGGMAGISLNDDAKVIGFFVSKTLDSIVVTAAHSSQSIAGTEAGSIKLSKLSEFPSKGRATGGVRAQRFIKTEDALYFAGMASNPLAAMPDGKPLEIPSELSKRDASGNALAGRIGSLGESSSQKAD